MRPAALAVAAALGAAALGATAHAGTPAWTTAENALVAAVPGVDRAHLETCLAALAQQVGWLDDHTVAIASGPRDHALRFVVRHAFELDDLGATVDHAYGTIDVAHDVVAAQVHLVLASRVAAVAAALKATAALAVARQSGQIPAPYQALVGSLVVVAHGDELVVTSRLPMRALDALLATLAAGT